MPRNFSAATDRIDVPANAAINNQNEFVWCAWIYPRSGGQGTDFGRIATKNNVKNFTLGNPSVGETGFSVSVQRSITNYVRTTSNRVLFDNWYFVVFSFSLSGNLGNVVIFNSDLTLNFEVNDSGATVGDGAPLDDSPSSFLIGGRDTDDRTFDGLIGEVKLIPSYFYDLDLYRSIALGMRHNSIKPAVDVEIEGVQSPEPDYSGNGLNAVLTGTTKGDGIPTTPYSSNFWGTFPTDLEAPPPIEDFVSNENFDFGWEMAI